MVTTIHRGATRKVQSGCTVEVGRRGQDYPCHSMFSDKTLKRNVSRMGGPNDLLVSEVMVMYPKNPPWYRMHIPQQNPIHMIMSRDHRLLRHVASPIYPPGNFSAIHLDDDVQVRIGPDEDTSAPLHRPKLR